MVLLYKGTELDISSFSVEGVPRKSCNLEAKIVSLEEILREKDKMIALFENQMITLKVKIKLIFIIFTERVWYFVFLQEQCEKNVSTC